MNPVSSVMGMLHVTVTSADVGNTLSAIAAAGIAVFDVKQVDELTVALGIHRRDYRRLWKFAEKRGARLDLRNRSGIYWTAKGLICRPILALGLFLLMVLSLWIPGRVLFVRVEGNKAVSSNQILEAAADCGIRLGASRRDVRSEQVKNNLLARIPGLQWAGVNTEGCVAVISVREREVTEEYQDTSGVSSILSACDGVVLSVTARKGSAKCIPGQAVKAGDILISGYTDCGLTVTATHAEGEIFAATGRKLAVQTPHERIKRNEVWEKGEKYSLIVGKKRIIFDKGSGICDATCVKMYTEYCLTLPGGFSLPVIFAKETVLITATEAEAIPYHEAEEQMRAFASSYLQSLMIAGTVSQRLEAVTEDDGVYTMAGVYACTEMIGREQTEEIGVLQ